MANKIKIGHVEIAMPTMTVRQAKSLTTLMVNNAMGAERDDDKELFLRIAEALQNAQPVQSNVGRDNNQP